MAITQMIEVDVSAARLHAFVTLIEKHAAAHGPGADGNHDIVDRDAVNVLGIFDSI